MRLPRYSVSIATLAFAGLVCLAGAVLAVDRIEARTHAGIVDALEAEGVGDWSSVEVDGLQVTLTGTAPSEPARFRAVAAAGTVVDAARVIDMMDVAAGSEAEAPPFKIEILRNDNGISLIGLIPASTDREAVVASVAEAAGTDQIADLLETADYEAPEGWDRALGYAIASLARLPRAKLSLSPDVLAVTAITDSTAEQRRLETDIARGAPDGLRIVLDISAPRPVITPFTLRFLKSGSAVRFDACSADTDETRDRIISAAVAAGLQGKAECRVGLGVPSPRWGDAVVAGIGAVGSLPEATITFSDTDVTLVAPADVPQSDFDRATGALSAALPDSFSLTATHLEPDLPEAEGGPPRFTASLAEDGTLRIAGPVPDDRSATVVESFAEARFGVGHVQSAAQNAEALPQGWTVRVLAALEALSQVDHGDVSVQPDAIALKGSSGRKEARDEIARILTSKLGEGTQLALDVTYVEALDPTADLPTPEECVSRINAILAARQVTFEPGSATIDGAAAETIGKIADIVKQCPDVQMEIGGHTDSQGREEMNLALSQSRAEAVLNALLARRVLTSGLTARGYGETQPIADNGTEEGREANRRIEFRLVLKDEEAKGAEPDGDGDGDGGAVSEAAPAEQSPEDGQVPESSVSGPDEAAAGAPEQDGAETQNEPD